jgi:hypothetical protein
VASTRLGIRSDGQFIGSACRLDPCTAHDSWVQIQVGSALSLPAALPENAPLSPENTPHDGAA